MIGNVHHILDQISVWHDLASHIMLIGIVQGVFLSLIIMFRAAKNAAVAFLGWTLLFQSIVFLDVYLCYTGLMKYVIPWNDSTEPIVLLIGPAIYFFIHRLLVRKPLNIKKIWIHFILPVGYALTQIPYYTAPIEVKLNAYLGAYHSHLDTANVPDSFSHGYHWIKDYFHYLVLFSFLFYSLLSAALVWKERKRIASLPGNAKKDKYTFTRNSVLVLTALFIVLFSVFYSYEDDGGDHLIGIFNTAITFLTSAIILMESRFFEKSWVADKYETLKGNSIAFEEIEHAAESEQFYLNENASLKSLADILGSNSNLVSKMINSKTGSNFNDYINLKRVRMAKERLCDSNYAHLTVEAIGHSVGFKSKSAFYNAFKKHVGESPSSFLKTQNAQKDD
ncbi:helix-turn-helix domain-containing protein [Muricauda sp. JGD-17]|uniref:Helix-turn-helix domain-containing protein n=1 Tax=Flagellimonas ochracea TaxID=2696472 RepID=A0A964TBY6_9FLAO|nr:AraC family transcriptional regulator [Allomuricauda ochracea]NAY92053.1 helix-turn-helix domain-containing protein [Allomuricauda ochracea]